MHVHAEHSNYGAATMTETFSYAFKPLSEGGAGLDFMTLSDYVSGYPAWNEIGRYQSLYPKNLVIRSDEVITYKGHTNNHASAKFVDYRTTPVYERLPDRSLKLLRGGREPRELFREVQGGWLDQIDHPQISPPTTPAAAALCRGCFWEYSDAQTDPSQLDALEIATGPWNFGGYPNPFTPPAIAEYERLLGLGHRIAAVGSSDSHKAGATSGALEAPIGQATTVVRAGVSRSRAFAAAFRRATIREGQRQRRSRPALLGAAVGQDPRPGDRGRRGARPAPGSGPVCSAGRGTRCS